MSVGKSECRKKLSVGKIECREKKQEKISVGNMSVGKNE